MLEHFDRDNSVKLGFGIKVVDVIGDDVEIFFNAKSFGFSFDINSLRTGVGHNRQFRIGILLSHPQ